MLLLRSFSPDGSGSPPYLIRREKGGCCFDAKVDADAAGHLVVAFNRSIWGGVVVRRYGYQEGPRAVPVDPRTDFGKLLRGVEIDPSGGFVVVFTRDGQEPTDRESGGRGVFGRRYGVAGREQGPEFHVNTFRRGNQGEASLAMASGSGAFVVTWQSEGQDGSGSGVYAQRFAADGERLGGEFLVPQSTEGDQERPVVAMDGHGNFVVAWIGPDRTNPSRTAIFAQRFAANGERLGGESQVSEAADGFEDFPRVAMDPQGNYVVSWDHQPVGRSWMRLYRSDGTPVRKPVPLTHEPGQLAAQVAFAANGTFGAVWVDIGEEGGLEDLYTQRFSASPGAELCLFRRGELVCDTGRTGGTAEVRYPFGGEPGETGLLGDLDGDGRADPCVYRAGVFRCDTAHGLGPPIRIRFGQTGDLPLLGDLDGDGKADPCVYRSGRFLCDTSHDGHGAERETAFGGQAGDVPLLGDVDGDGKADPCVFRRGAFLCSSAHDGNASVTIAFGQAGDMPLLGDFDDDGRADPCVYRAGQLRCDTAHDGGAAEGLLTFGDGDGVPLLGNLDGL